MMKMMKNEILRKNDDDDDETGWYMLENDKNLKLGGSSVYTEKILKTRLDEPFR